MVGDLTPTPVPQGTVPITGTGPSAPTTVYTVYKATQRVRLTEITAANIHASTSEQVHVGVRLESGSGTSDWEPLIAPILAAGEVYRWEGSVYMGAGDEVVGYGAAGSLVNITIGTEAV